MSATRRYTGLPRTDLNVFRLCMGTGNIGSTIDCDASYALLDAYVENGGNFIDTAKVYADWLDGERSVSEKTIGKWMKERKNRDKIVLATKGAHPNLPGPSGPRLGCAEIESDLKASLTNLQTDCIDLYWLHRDDPNRPVEYIVEALNDQVAAGRIRYFAFSNWRAPRIRAANEYAARNGIAACVASQAQWSLAVADTSAAGDPTLVVMDDDLIELHRATGLAAIPYSATANGLFQKLAQDKFNTLDAFHQGMYRDPENRQRLGKMRQVMERTGLSMIQVVLGYLLSYPFVTVPIIGPRLIEQLTDSLTAVDTRLEESDVQFLMNG